MRRSFLLLCLLAAAGCGTERQPPGDPLAPQPRAGGPLTVVYPGAGVTLNVPRNWTRTARPLPGIFALSSGEAQLVGWAYERDGPLPRGGKELEAARDELVREIRRRDPDFALLSARIARVAGSPAVVLTGRQTIEGRRVATRSAHLYRGEVEYVFEGLAPPRYFARVDGEVFRPVIESLRLRGRIRTSFPDE